MFQFNQRRTARVPLNTLSNSQSSLIDNRRTCPIKCSLPIIIIFIALSLILFSLYLSSQILPSTTEFTASIPNKPSLNLKHPSIPSINTQTLPISDASSNKIMSQNDAKWDIALKKSMDLYINRAGHKDRVEYLIGFRETRITNAEDYKSLQTRNTQKYDRDYSTTPVSIKGWQNQPDTEHVCDALCVSCRTKCDVNGIKWSMENVEINERTNHITGNTKLSSLVPVPYFSWHDFQFMLPIKPKTASAIAAAFISNCSSRKRNKMVVDLQKYGVTVHSFGRCEHNKDEERGPQGNRGNKIDILQTYKFSLAFENSETDDYITEKFFGSLQAGAVPVYIGSPNVKFFAPDFGVKGAGKPWKSSSVIWAGDYDFDAEKLAEYLLYLDSNDTAYNEYLQWKTDGFTGDFKAMVELTAATHTNCRQCILATDWQRYKHGIGAYDAVMGRFEAESDAKDGKWFYVRERGMYRFTLIQMETNTLQAFIKRILMTITPKPVNFWINNQHPDYSRIGPALYAIYHVPNKHVIHSNAAIQNLPNFAELEVIFV